ncbi:MAG: RNA methyltransferase [Bacteroidales bacterium 45-6]|nr:MAG: RNA methyltransferase [Bacteroidales bacterium 45-6]
MRKLKITELPRITADEFKKVDKIPLVVVLDQVRSLNNIGSVFRTSDAFRIESIYLCGITATPPHPEIHKTALGAEFSVDWKYFENTADAVRELQSQAVRVFAIEQVDMSVMLQDFEVQPRARYAIVFGNEVKGVDQEVVNLCNGSIEIPQFGTKHSLNVSVTAGIVIWDLFQKLNHSQPIH